ncbi:MAG: DNA polymerase III subunit delta [Lachnospiraceae bacterium]|nr:DNA polymerase III subunit delta [Lachnospiraceae bacterium]
MDSIKEDIKNESFRRLYLIYGSESYLANLNKKKLSDAVVPPDDTMNRTVFYGKDIRVRDIIGLSETLPFMSSRRLILIEDSGFFKKAPSDADELLEYMGHIPEETVIIFSETDVDKRGKLFKAVGKYGTAVLCEEQKEDALAGWIGSYLSGSGKKIRKSTAALLLERTGNDMYTLKNEMDKLISFSGDRDEITEDDIDKACVLNLRASVFAMIDDITALRQKKALERYYELVLLREAPMKILILITRQFNLLLLAKELSAEKKNYKELAGIMKIPEFSVRKYVSAAGRLSKQRILSAVRDCVQTDNDIKKGLINDRIGTELLIMKYSAAEAEENRA